VVAETGKAALSPSPGVPFVGKEGQPTKKRGSEQLRLGDRRIVLLLTRIYSCGTVVEDAWEGTTRRSMNTGKDGIILRKVREKQAHLAPLVQREERELQSRRRTKVEGLSWRKRRPVLVLYR